MAERAFPFEGSDVQYIKYLEGLVLRTKNSDTAKSPAQSSRFVEWKPDQYSVHQNSTSMRLLSAFIDGIPANDRWEEARLKAGIDTPSRNYQALRLISGHPDPAIFQEKYDTAVQPPDLPPTSAHLVARVCEYGKFMAECSHDRNFAISVVNFQKLVFCSYCVVMIRNGISKETTNATMRRYTGPNQSDRTLETYRNGALWANRCISSLLQRGWGYKSWEIFILNSQSPAQIARLAANDAKSYKIVSDRLGQMHVPLWENNWIPYCLPCIVQYITGYTIPLLDICNALDYEETSLDIVQATSKYFVESVNLLFPNDSSLPSLTGQGNVEMTVARLFH